MLLKNLCEKNGVSGDEKEIREYIKSLLPHYLTEEDAMGNLLVSGGGEGKKIMLCAHMDEVGLIISCIEDNGFLRFKTIGGINTDVMLGKKVYIGKEMVPGIIGICAVHLQSDSQRKEAVKEENMYIDIGCRDREEAEKVVSLGDTAVFPPHYEEFGDGLIDARAIDDRVGCAVIIRLLENHYEGINLCAAFTAQEETGTRGGGTAAEHLSPDYAVVLESTFSADIFPTEPALSITSLGKGPAITFMDRVATPDKMLVSSITLTAKLNKIPWQMKRVAGGGTDAGVVSKAQEGIPTAIVAVPCRNLHSPSLVISKEDYENTYLLLDTWLRTIAPSL